MNENNESSQEPSFELIVCPSCIHENQPYVDYCENCGAPISPTVNYDPYKRIASQGWLYRKSASEPRRLITVIGMWLIFAPWLIFLVVLFYSTYVHPIGYVVVFLLGFIPAVILFRTTKNYLRKRSEFKAMEENDLEEDSQQ